MGDGRKIPADGNKFRYNSPKLYADKSCEQLSRHEADRLTWKANLRSCFIRPSPFNSKRRFLHRSTGHES